MKKKDKESWNIKTLNLSYFQYEYMTWEGGGGYNIKLQIKIEYMAENNVNIVRGRLK